MLHVLVAHDLSARSEIALARAARLAMGHDGHLTVLHIVDSDLPRPVVEAQRRQAEEHLLGDIRRRLSHDKPSRRIEIASGDPAATVAAQAESLAVDLVVVGRHRRRLLTDMFTGTTVERLLRQVHRAILVVNSADLSPYQRVLLPVDFSELSMATVRFTAAFLPEASLHLLHAYRGPLQDYVATLALTFSREERAKLAGSIGEQAKQVMSQMIEALGLEARRPRLIVVNGGAEAAIREELAWQRTDLVVMGTNARTGVARALIGSVAETILKSTTCDMLIIPTSGSR